MHGIDEGTVEKCRSTGGSIGAASCRRRQIGPNCFVRRRGNSPPSYSTHDQETNDHDGAKSVITISEIRTWSACAEIRTRTALRRLDHVEEAVGGPLSPSAQERGHLSRHVFRARTPTLALIHSIE
jgi:hypothetical protein